jgi:fatty acid desaturase
VEHHLFPQIPRHNLKKVHERVAKFCKDEGMSFKEADMIDGTIDVLSHLRAVSAEFVEHFPAL